jgi:hypothetical protein
MSLAMADSPWTIQSGMAGQADSHGKRDSAAKREHAKTSRDRNEIVDISLES